MPAGLAAVILIVATSLSIVIILIIAARLVPMLLVMLLAMVLILLLLMSQLRTVFTFCCTGRPLGVRVLICFLAPMINGGSTTLLVLASTHTILLPSATILRQHRIAITKNNTRQQRHQSDFAHVPSPLF